MAIEGPVSAPAERALRDAETAGLKLALGLRLAIVAAIVAALAVALETVTAIEFGAVALLWAGLGAVYARLAARPLGRGWAGYVFVVLDAALLVGAALLVMPAVAPAWPEQTVFRFGTASALFVLLALYGLSATPALMIWAGAVSVAAWAGGLAWVLALPTTLSVLTDRTLAAASESARAALFLDPQYVPTLPRLYELAALALLAGTLAVAAGRRRGLVRRAVAETRVWSRLQRQLPPARAAAAAELAAPLGAPREADVAVLAMAPAGAGLTVGTPPPAAVIGALAGLRARVARGVFEHGGCLTGDAGDGATAAFGALDEGPRDAADAVACARGLLVEVEGWNDARHAAGEDPVGLCLGIHYGGAVVGDAGGDGAPELAAVGDAADMARRLAVLCGELGCRLAVSDGLMRAVRAELGAEADALLAGLAARGVQRLPGRDITVAVWAL